MKLPSLPFLERKEKPEYFLALVLRNEEANAVIFEELSGKIRVVGKHKEHFKNSIEDASIDELLEVLDKTVSTAEQFLPTESKTIKTIFGVKETWVEDNKIKRDYLLKLKKVSDELGLEPIGFLVIFEAIAHLLAKEEGAPVSTILVEIGKKFVSVALVRAGRITETKTSEIPDSPALTVDTLLKHFTSSEILPSRITIFDADEDITQEFINHRWGKSLPFLHIPQVTTLADEFDARAVLFGAATQMGFEVFEEELQEEFIEEESLEKKRKEGLRETEEVSSEYLGFVENKDVAKKPPPKKEEPQIPQEIVGEQIAEIPEEELEEAQKKQLPQTASMILLGVRDILFRLFKNLKKNPVKRGLSILPKNQTRFLIPIVAVIILVILLYVFVTRAEVSLTINPKTVKQNQNVIFSISATTNPSKSIISAELASISEDGSISTAVTGEKETGTKAKGTVTIFNNSTDPQTLSSDTSITSSNGLEFVLDKNVTVSSASGDIFTGTTPGKANMSVTATKIGTEYNLPSNVKFSIGESLSIAAKNDNPFSGGTKKNIKVVSKDDVAKLLADLPKKLEQKARDDLSKKISNDKTLLPVFINTKIDNKNFDKNVGDEASEVTLKGSVGYQGISYAKNDLISFSQTLLKNETSNDLAIDPTDIRVETKDVRQQENKDVSANLTITAIVKPKINDKKIRKEISGKSVKQAQEILSKIPEVSNVNVMSYFSLPFIPKMLPILPGNIKITIRINE